MLFHDFQRVHSEIREHDFEPNRFYNKRYVETLSKELNRNRQDVIGVDGQLNSLLIDSQVSKVVIYNVQISSKNNL